MSEQRTHHYRARCHWQGSTGAGYECYGRAHRATTPPALSPIDLSADPAFRGDPQRCNPEQLLVLAAASCQLLSFLAVAARARVDVRGYDDEAEGVMPENTKPVRLSAIRLRPTITVGPGHSHERLAHLVELAHRECYIAHSVTCEITVEPTFRVLGYAFGDSEVARRRLAVLAEVFGPSSRSLLGEHAPPRTRLAVDLGCGPGATTRLVAEATGAQRTVGLDCSLSFLAAARAEHAGAGIDFAEHDVTRVPFPAAAGAADVIFARFLLAHLPDLAGTLSAWLGQLHPLGVLVIEETETIETGNPVFRRYLDLAERLVATRGASLYPGAALAELAASSPARVLTSRICQVGVAAGRAAELFALNLAVWRSDPAVGETTDALDRLAHQLGELRQSSAAERVRWQLRQLVLDLPDRRAGDLIDDGLKLAGTPGGHSPGGRPRADLRGRDRQRLLDPELRDVGTLQIDIDHQGCPGERWHHHAEPEPDDLAHAGPRARRRPPPALLAQLAQLFAISDHGKGSHARPGHREHLVALK